MCLSPQVDLVAGTAISIFAFDALRNNPNIRTLPIIVPIATLLIEPPGWRRFSLAILSLTGLLVGGIFWQNIAAGKSSVVAGERYLDFHVEGVPSLVRKSQNHHQPN
jgi:hypothetical protein